MKLPTNNRLPEEKKKTPDQMMRNEYPDADENPNEDDSLMPRAGSRCAVWFETCGADRDAQEKERNQDATLRSR